MDSKKKVLTIVVGIIWGLCAAVFLAGTVLIAVVMSDEADKLKKQDQQERKLKQLSNQKDNLKFSEGNIKLGKQLEERMIKAGLDRFTAVMQPKRYDLKSYTSTDATAFRSMLNEKTRALATLCEKNAVQVAPEAATFGFSRYLDSSEQPPQDKLKTLNCEFDVIQAIVTEFAKSSHSQDLLLRSQRVVAEDKHVWTKILDLDREAIELPESRRKSGLAKDELRVEIRPGAEKLGLSDRYDNTGKSIDYISLRRGDNAYAFVVRLKVATDTGTLRHFVNALKNYSFYVRNLRVFPVADSDYTVAKETPKTADPAAAAGMDMSAFGFFDDGNAAGTAAPATPQGPQRVVVIDEKPREFTLLIEYFVPFELDDEDDKSAANDDDEGDEIIKKKGKI